MLATKIDRLTEEAIRRLVDDFYAKIRVDPELGPIFARAIPGDWGPHLATMRKFWSSVMLTTGHYKGNPVAVHQRVAGIRIGIIRSLVGTIRAKRAANCSMKAWLVYFTRRRCALPKALSSPFFTGQTGPGQAAHHDICRHR